MKTKNNIYFIGIGGIGMSALARYFLANGHSVAGYDRTESELTAKLKLVGAEIHYADDIQMIPLSFTNKENTTVVYTPAVPSGHSELTYFKENGFELLKRSQMLGRITEDTFCIAVAGTHGKTTTSTMIAHLLKDSGKRINAFLGGVAANYSSNLILDDIPEYTVVEADEFDRSFLTLKPNIAVVTSTDPDHLDIYGDHTEMKKTFQEFVDKIEPDGLLIQRKGLNLKSENATTYAIDENADADTSNVHIENEAFHFDFEHNNDKYTDLILGMPGKHNVENATAAMVVSKELKISEDKIRAALQSFRGVQRRFQLISNTTSITYIDDYAHHPTEISAAIESAKMLYPNRKLTVVFQPHLFSRTRDFLEEFATSLTKSDEVILLDIYPARELPIEGVSSQVLLDKIKNENKALVVKETLVDFLMDKDLDVLMTLGAGDIDRLVAPLKHMITQKGKEVAND